MEDFVPTRVSKIKKDAVKEFLSVSYEESKKKREHSVCKSEEKHEDSTEDKYQDERRKQELEMKRIRYEVMKFGMSGFEKAKANEAKVALAISLGAKPLKRKGVNYKVLKIQRQKEKEAQKSEQRTSGLEKSVINLKRKLNRKKKSDGILRVYGKVSKKNEK